ncbi:MAG: PAS domain S-box protein, partial [Sphingobacteriaceae bacterium]
MLSKEIERLQAVNRFLKLEFSKEKELQEIVELAAKICETPVALLTFIDESTQHIKFSIGTNAKSASREDTFCNYAITGHEVMIVPDTLKDVRFANNPFVTGDAGIRFYAGTPVTTQDGYNLGSLCVFDQKAKELTDMQQQMLEILSKQAIHLLEFDASLRILKEQFVQVQESAIKLQSFFESSSACHLLLNKKLEVIAFNKAAERFAEKNYDARLNIGIRITDFIHPEHVGAFKDNCQIALSGIPVELERNLTYQNGQNIWWALIYEPARNPDGEIIGISYNATDITRRIEQEQKVWAQNESLRRIA